MQTAVIKRSIVLDGHKTSVSLENEFWLGLREIRRPGKYGLIDARRENRPRAQ